MSAPLEPTPPHDPELDRALKKVLQVILKDHPLKANQVLVLSAEIQRLGIHRLVEEHIAKFEGRQGRSVGPVS